MKVEIIDRQESGTCSLSGKKETEVFGLKVNGGEVMQVSTQRLPEILRMLCCVGAGVSSSPMQKPASG